MRPCDCEDMHTARTKLSEQGIKFNGNGIEIVPRMVVLTEGPATVRIPMEMFKRYAEWFLADQKAKGRPLQST